MTVRAVVGLAAMAVTAALSGCGSSSSSNVGNSYKTARPAVVTTPKAGVQRETVTIASVGGTYAYKPKALTVRAGALVTWKNTTGTAHTVTFLGRNLPDTRVDAGTSITATFTRGGSYAYHCTIHPYMKGVVIVKAP